MKYRNFICRIIAAVIMVTSVCSSLSASAIEGVSFASPSRARSSQTYTTTQTGSEYMAYSADAKSIAISTESNAAVPSVVTTAVIKQSAETTTTCATPYIVSSETSYEVWQSPTYADIESISADKTSYSYNDSQFDVENITINVEYKYNTDTAVFMQYFWSDGSITQETVMGHGHGFMGGKAWYENFILSDLEHTLEYSSPQEAYKALCPSTGGDIDAEIQFTCAIPNYDYNNRYDTLTDVLPVHISAPEIHLTSPDSDDLIMGNTFALDYTLDYSSEVPLEWSSSDENVASVDSSGNVTINGAGTVTVTARVNEYISDSVTFTVYTTLTLYSPDESDLFAGNTIAVEYSAKNYDYIQWSSSDKNIASVDGSGNVTINGLGTVTISAEAGGYSLSGDSYASDYVSFRTYDVLNLGKTYSSSIKSSNSNWFKFTAPAEGAYIFESTGSCNTVGELFSEMSQGTSLAYNDDGGTISNFKITYSLTKGQTVWLEVTGYNGNAVSAYDVSVVSDSGQTASPAIVPSSLTMNPGDTSTLFAINVPDGASVLWTSDNTSVVTVSDGVVKAIAPGTAKIYAIVESTLLSCTVTVVSESYFPGDVDLNGEIGISDVVKVMCYSCNKEKYPLSAAALDNADVYQRGDGVSALDALSIQKRLTQVIIQLPES